MHAFDDDESYAPRIVVPDEYTADNEPQLISYARPPSCDPSIRDEPMMPNGKTSPPFANGYSTSPRDDYEGRTDTIQLTMLADRPPSPHGVIEYTDSDIITTTSSQKSLDKQPHNAPSPTVSVETEI